MLDLARRLFSSFWDVVTHSTRVERAILPIALFVASFVFQKIKAQGLHIPNLILVVVPAIWVACTQCGYFFFKAAKNLRQNDVATWQEWRPVLKEAEILRPPRPSARPLLLLTGSICLVLILVSWGLTALIPPILPVSVFPSRVTFHQSARDEQYTFAVTNGSDQDWYSAVVEIQILTTLPIEQFHFDSDHNLLTVGGDIGKIGDPFVLTNPNKKAPFPEWWFLYYRLKAHETREIKVTRDNIGEIGVTAKVTGLAAEPQPLNVTNNSVMFRFSKDYSIKIQVRKPGE